MRKIEDYPNLLKEIEEQRKNPITEEELIELVLVHYEGHEVPTSLAAALVRLSELRKLAKAMVDASNPTPGNRNPWRFNVGDASDANRALYAYFYPNCPLRES